VLPVALPLPQGEGSVPNIVELVEDDAPLVPGAISSPAAASVVSNRAVARVRIPDTLFVIRPPV
jgi:hypothetical protein